MSTKAAQAAKKIAISKLRQDLDHVRLSSHCAHCKKPLTGLNDTQLARHALREDHGHRDSLHPLDVLGKVPDHLLSQTQRARAERPADGITTYHYWTNQRISRDPRWSLLGL